LTRPVDLVVPAGEENERTCGSVRQAAECQYTADENEVVAAIVQGVALALEMGQSTREERHAGRAQDRLKAQPLVGP
jgi:hypothetical protein